MTIFNPEIIYSRGADEASRRSWLERNFTKVKRYSQAAQAAFVPQGHGGLYLAAPTPITLNLTTSWQKVTGFTNEAADQSIGMEMDLANDRLRLTEPGLWYWSFDYAANFTSFATDGQKINVGLYDETTGIPLGWGIEAIPRNSDVFHVSRNLLRTESARVGHWFSLHIRQGVASPTVALTMLDGLELSGFRLK